MLVRRLRSLRRTTAKLGQPTFSALSSGYQRPLAATRTTFWGPRDFTGESVIVLDDRQDRLEDLFASVTRVANVYHPYSMPSEHFEVFYCRGLKWLLNEMWPKLKSWD